jgi:hypothetical protein
LDLDLDLLLFNIKISLPTLLSNWQHSLHSNLFVHVAEVEDVIHQLLPSFHNFHNIILL